MAMQRPDVVMMLIRPNGSVKRHMPGGIQRGRGVRPLGKIVRYYRTHLARSMRRANLERVRFWGRGRTGCHPDHYELRSYSVAIALNQANGLHQAPQRIDWLASTKFGARIRNRFPRLQRTEKAMNDLMGDE
jgi:hypothetical protein